MATAFVVLVLLGAVGFFVYRNNKAKADALAQKVKDEAQSLKAKL